MNAPLIFILLAILSYILVLFIRRYATRRSILDIPSERSSHTIPTPRGGGLAIVILTILAVLVLTVVNGEWKESLIYVAGASVLAYLGWRDDVKSMPARIRILFQGLVAAGTIIGLGYFDALPFPFIGEIHLGIFGILLTFIWIVGLTNAYNFMDGIDGIAGGVALAGGLGWLILIFAGAGATSGLTFWLALTIAAASLGFLGHNWFPAKIFMGDVGSVFLGYSFAVMPLLVENQTARPLMFGILIMWVFIIDAGVTFIRRAYKHEKLFSAHRSHLYQRLVIGGMKHSTVSLIYVGLTFAGVVLALGWLGSTIWAQWLILLGIPIFWAVFYYFGTRQGQWQKITAYVSLFREMGLEWVVFRMGYSLRMKLGLIRRSSPAYYWTDIPLSQLVRPGIPTDLEGFAAWRMNNTPTWFHDDIPVFPKNIAWDSDQVMKEAGRILAGEWKYFSHEWIKTGFPPDWHLDPKSGVKLDPNIHWSRINEFGDFDIKYVWEASRFSTIFTLVRAYAHLHDDRYAEAFWRMVDDWMEKNPPGWGPNWIDGQEAALRLLAVCFGYFTFRLTDCSTPERICRLTMLAGALGKKINQDLEFAHQTEGNHAFSVSVCLWICGLVFPELKDAAQYSRKGRSLFEKEISRQIFSDGGYAMYSINYHRFVLHMSCLALRLGELNHQPFSDEAYGKLRKSVEYMSQLVEVENGEVPLYGSNDGALVLPLNSCDYGDYRPVLQLTNYVAHGKRMFPGAPWDEDLFWLYGESALDIDPSASLAQADAEYPDGGIYVLHGEKSKVVLRCTDFHARPSHADQLHMDLWWNGVNLTCDAGTYLYHGAGIWQNGLARTAVHNTVCVDGMDQMTHLSRFTWVNRAKGKVLRNGVFEGRRIWEARHDGYQRLSNPVDHIRSVINLGEDRWLVVDRLTASQVHEYALQWLLADLPYQLVEGQSGLDLNVNGKAMRVITGVDKGNAEFSVVRGSEDSTRGWRSKYYGEKHPAISAILTVRAGQSMFWTLFIPEGCPAVSRDELDGYLKWISR